MLGNGSMGGSGTATPTKVFVVRIFRLNGESLFIPIFQLR